MYVKVYVTPDARRESIEKENATTFRIKVREPRERNLANSRVRVLLAKEFAVDKKTIRLISGHRSSTKVFDVLLNLTDKT